MPYAGGGALHDERRRDRNLDEIVAQRGAPEFIRSEKGPEFVAKVVKDWITEKGFKTLFIKPGSPWQNCYSESFNARFRDEFLNVESVSSLLDAKVLGEEHRDKLSIADHTHRWET